MTTINGREITTKYPPSTWWKYVSGNIRAGISRTFILHGDTGGQVRPTMTLRDYMTSQLNRWDLVVFFDRANGIQFPHPSMKETYLKLVGREMPGEAERAANLAAQSMLGSITGQPQGRPGWDPDMPTDVAGSIAELGVLLRDTTRKDINLAPGEMLPKESDLRWFYHIAVFIEAAETIVPDGVPGSMSPEDRTTLVSLLKWGTDNTIAGGPRLAFLVTDTLTDINAKLRAAGSRWDAVLLPKPNDEQRQAYVQMLDEAEAYPFQYDADMDLHRLVTGTAGLGLNHIQDIIMRASAAGVMTREHVRERKAEIVKGEFGDVLEYYDPDFGWDAIAGYDYLKKFFNTSVVKALRTGNKRRCPMGVLMAGVPGGGKTIIAKALAKEAGVNFFILNIARIKGMYVGVSERNLERALAAIEEQGGIVFIDELDQAFRRDTGGSGDSGVSSNLFKRLLEFLSDKRHKGRIVFVAATNRPDLIDDALKRAGRFDKIVPVLRPDEYERQAIFLLHAKTNELQIDDIPLDNPIVKGSDGWAASEIAEAVETALEIYLDDYNGEGNPLIALQEAVEETSVNLASHRRYEDLALKACRSKRMLPPSLRQRKEELDKAAATETVAVPRGRMKQDMMLGDDE